MTRFDQVRVVLFDAVGTLIYPDPPVVEVYHLTGWSHGSQLSPAQIAERFPRAFKHQQAAPVKENDTGQLPYATSEAGERDFWRRVVGEVFDDVPPSSFERLFAALWDHFASPEQWRLFADVPAVWRELQAREYLVGIASNLDARLKEILRNKQPLDRCEALFVSSQIGFRKPARQFFAAIEQRLQIPGEQILLVGDDAQTDVAGALAAGWQAVLLSRGAPTNLPTSIATLSELLELLPKRVEERA